MQLALLSVALATLLRRQPVRCALSVCKPFESACAKDGECVTDKCYEGKCGLGVTCSAHNTMCFTDGPHTCCTGECMGVVVKADCLKLLNLDDTVAAHQGINVDRQCERVGVCQHWPDADPGPGVLTKPWAVDPADMPAKYYALAGLTFAAGTTVDVPRVISRRMGRAHDGVSPKSTKPRAVTDAGILRFNADSRLARELFASYRVGDEMFCVAPVLEGGEGGAYFAAGINCCADKEFTCGDQGGTSAVVVSSHLPEFAQARLLLEAQQGASYHGEGRGIETPAPMYVTWSENPEAEQLSSATGSTTGMSYVMPTNTTFCAAPIGATAKVGFIAIGQDCCDDTSFTCGDAADPAALSGKLAADITGDYIQAAQQGKFKYGYEPDRRPIFMTWTSETMVPDPR